MMLFEGRTLWFLDETSIFPMQTWMPKTVRFLSRNQGALSSSLTSLPKEKHQPLRMWTNLKFTKLSEKARSTVLSRSNQRYESFHTGITWHVGYLPVIILSGDIEGGCVWQCTCILKDWSHKGNKRSVEISYSLTWLTIYQVEKYCHDAPKRGKGMENGQIQVYDGLNSELAAEAKEAIA